jgi:hypothetical protein
VRQKKGIYFKCNDKYSWGHRCKCLFMIEACLGEDDDRGMIMVAEEGKKYIFQHQFPKLSLEDKGNIRGKG